MRDISRLHHSVLELRKLRPVFRKALRSDQRCYISAVANAAASSSTRDVVQKLRPLLGPPRRKQRGAVPLPALTLENGDFASTPAEADARWLRHFSSVEQGGPISSQDMVLRCLERQRAQDLEMLEVSELDLPTRCELERSLRAAKPGRAAGNDGLPPDILHSFAGPLSAILYPILLKIAFRLQEPLHFKGGTVRQIWKCKGPLEHCSSYRGILVSNTAGKSIHGAFRQRCGDWYNAAATPLQIGGRKGFPVQLAAQAVREFQSGHLRRGLSVAVVFLDLREAFHKVCRPLVHGGDLSDCHLTSVMQSLELGPECLPELRSYVAECSRLQAAGASPWAAAVIKEFQADSWLTIGQGLAAVESGTRPGDSLADIVFSFLFAAVLHKVRDTLCAKGYAVHLPWHATWFRSICAPDDVSRDSLAPVDVSWMDDLALLLSAPTPEAVAEAVSGATATLLDECLRALLQPNLDPGKTEALVSLVGPASRRVRSDLFRSRDPSLSLPSVMWPGARVRLVPSYKHLGGILHWSGLLKAELKARCAQAWQAFRKHRRLIFGSPTVTHREKALIFLSLVATRLLYGAGTWVLEGDAQTSKLQGTLLAMTRQMLRPMYDREASLHLGGRKVLSVARIPSVHTLLHVERLRHLAVVMRVAPQEFWAILHYGGKWCELARDSVAWLSKQLALGGHPEPTLEQWEHASGIMLDSPLQWKRWVRRAQQVALLAELWDAEVQHYHGLLLRQLLALGATHDDDTLDRPQNEACAVCQQRFRDLRCWSHHAFKKHGRVKESRLFSVGTQCQACLKHFASTFHLSNHLDYSAPCLAFVAGQIGRVELEPGRGSKKFNDGSNVMLPAVRAAGPTRQRHAQNFVPESRRPDESVLQGLEWLFCREDEVPDFISLLAEVRKLFLRTCLQQSRLRATAEAWRLRVQDELACSEEISVRWASWHSRISLHLCQIDFVEWLVPDAEEGDYAASTFRDCSVVLPWLSFEHVTLPSVEDSGGPGCTLISKDRSLLDRGLRPGVRWFGHQICSRQPSLLDFTAWSGNPHSTFGFCLVGLLGSLAPVAPISTFKKLEPRLHSLRLFADLVRGVTLLWSHGVRAFLVAEPIDCPGLSAVRRLAPLTTTFESRLIISNFPEPLSSFVSLS